ncbi:hypothetical protein [Niabella hibiscisoli]|uniref:hypothetical protein n=1 Tax=Niabella hibiscisoli TaxID=1825928 RepID=UPI001F0D765C|nr:hypothetical protein [Niabella hibiscisoli]MCH5718058.1 hypothetical protein [Niabella hibiscisoli]
MGIGPVLKAIICTITAIIEIALLIPELGNKGIGRTIGCGVPVDVFTLSVSIYILELLAGKKKQVRSDMINILFLIL